MSTIWNTGGSMLASRNIFFNVSVTEHWQKLPRDVMVFISLEILKKNLNIKIWARESWWLSLGHQEVKQDNSFSFNNSVNLWYERRPWHQNIILYRKTKEQLLHSMKNFILLYKLEVCRTCKHFFGKIV